MTDESFPRQNARTRRFTLGAPRDIRVASDGSLVTFLRSRAGDDPVNCLWTLDPRDGEEQLVVDPLEVVGDDSGTDLPEAERARRERAREAGEGIVGYSLDSSSRNAAFSLGGRVFLTDLMTRETTELPAAKGVFDPRLDPTGSLVSYVSGAGLRVVGPELADREIASEAAPTVSWGSAEFVAGEEMGRTRGHWWSPDGTRLAVERVDVDPINVWHLSNPTDPATEPRAIRYPAAGTSNAAVGLSLFSVDGGAPVRVEWDTDAWEYLADVQWSADGLVLVVQTRDQRTLAVLNVDESSGRSEEIHRQSDPQWVELVPGVPTWCAGRLLTVADRDGARRLQLDNEPVTGTELQVRSVLDADAERVVFTASTDPTETHVYELALTDPIDTPRRLTSTSGLHSASVGGPVRVISSAGLDHDGTRVTIQDNGVEIASIENLAAAPVIRPAVTLSRRGSNDLATALLLPSSWDGDEQLPIVLDPYGGPHAQRVVKARSAFLASQWLADQGFAVIVTDGRGTPGRGPDFERAVRGDLAQPVLDDQVEALHDVAADDERLDLTRVGIRGWSFGGYLAALAVLRRPDVFHAAVAGAPVTDWRLYDTHYTERYLGHPDEEPESYERTSLLVDAPKLTRPLLLIHGLVDDNVVVAHTLQLSQALLEAGRPHQVLPLSGVTHMTPQEVVAENLLELQVAFLREQLS